GSEVFENRGEINRGTGANALGVATGLEVASDAADGELKAGFGGTGNGLCGLGFPSSGGSNGNLSNHFIIEELACI
ncbi:hypothetical protein P7M25_25870, partial [Vibrio parahaemolyticus]|nr:hypothetical protein [Vibrio parahaemolyticus]